MWSKMLYWWLNIKYHKAICPARQYSHVPNGIDSHEGSRFNTFHQDSSIIPEPIRIWLNTQAMMPILIASIIMVCSPVGCISG